MTDFSSFLIDALRATIYGIIEGITEWLPISSTGHLILAKEFLGTLGDDPAFFSMFEVVIQLGAILAVLVIFFNKLNPISRDKSPIQKSDTLSLWGKIIVAVLPACLIIPFDDQLESVFFKSTIVAGALVFYGILFILIENKNKNSTPRITKLSQITYKTALIIGAFQLLAAIIPGTSRSGATILGAILIGCSRYVSAEFSFFLAIPVMFGASFLKIVKFLQNGSPEPTQIALLLIGTCISFIVSLFVVRMLMNFVKKHDFTPFGYYRIILGLVVLALGAFGLLGSPA